MKKATPLGSLFSFFYMVHALADYCADMVVGEGVVHGLALTAAFYEPIVLLNSKLVRYRRVGHVQHRRKAAHAGFGFE